MKQGLKPTKAQAQLLSDVELDYRQWLIVKDLPDFMVICHRETKEKREFEKLKNEVTKKIKLAEI